MKEIISRSVVICKSFTLSLAVEINILIVKYACMFFLISALKGYNDSQGSKSKAIAKWILVKVSHLNNARCLKNYVLLLCTLIWVNFEYINILLYLV